MMHFNQAGPISCLEQIVTLPVFDVTPSDPTLMLKTRHDSRTYPVAAKVMCLQVQPITKALDT